MIYYLPSHIKTIASNYYLYSTILISMVKYCQTFFPKYDLTIILGIPTYDYLQQIKLEIKTNTPSVHLDLRCH